jgi:Mg2+-importing ATPase
VSAALIVFVVRSSKPFFKSRPGKYLVVATLTVVAITIILPYTPIAGFIGFELLPPVLLGLLAVIIALYITTAELAKRLFYHWVKL